MTTPGLRRWHSVRDLARETRGTVFVEYVLVAFVCLLAASVLAGLGSAFVLHYSKQRAALYGAYP